MANKVFFTVKSCGESEWDTFDDLVEGRHVFTCKECGWEERQSFHRLEHMTYLPPLKCFGCDWKRDEEEEVLRLKKMAMLL